MILQTQTKGAHVRTSSICVYFSCNVELNPFSRITMSGFIKALCIRLPGKERIIEAKCVRRDSSREGVRVLGVGGCLSVTALPLWVGTATGCCRYDDEETSYRAGKQGCSERRVGEGRGGGVLASESEGKKGQI